MAEKEKAARRNAEMAEKEKAARLASGKPTEEEDSFPFLAGAAVAAAAAAALLVFY